MTAKNLDQAIKEIEQRIATTRFWIEQFGQSAQWVSTLSVADIADQYTQPSLESAALLHKALIDSAAGQVTDLQSQLEDLEGLRDAFVSLRGLENGEPSQPIDRLWDDIEQIDIADALDPQTATLINSDDSAKFQLSDQMREAFDASWMRSDSAYRKLADKGDS